MTARWVLAEAVAAMKSSRRRTLVTVVSLAWGVASFLILMSYGNGFDRAIREAFAAVGQDLVLTFGGQTSQQAGGLRSGRRIRLRKSDVEALREAVPGIGAISPEIMRTLPVVWRNREKEYRVRGAWPEYRRVRNMHIVEGRWISEEDRLALNRVAVLGANAARELFSGIPPVGEDLTVGGLRFTVVGVLDVKLQLANYSTRDNDCVFIPYETAAVFTSTEYPDIMVWTPLSPSVRNDAIRQVRATLASLHRFSPSDQRAVEILAFNEFMYIIDGMSMAVAALLGFVGALTLGIGGVGLANIMFASVLDRTREIGVLKAIGGRRRTILAQFLAESLLIVAIGGALGLLLGIGATLAIGSMPLWSAIFKEAAANGNGNDLKLQLSASAVLISTGVLFAVGLIAAMIPALKAARLDPIQALHYE